MKAFAALLLLLLLPYQAARGADVGAPTLDASISRGIDFLASKQNPDGSFGTKQKPAITGLSLLALLSSGQTADVGKHGPVVRAAIDYLLASSLPDGTFNREHDEKPMYAQAIATLALAQAYGVEESEAHRRKIASAIFRSVPVILKSQNVKKDGQFAGGWRYDMVSADSDLSVTGWNALAMRACQDVGVRVPADAVKRAGEFVLRCYDAQTKGFGYQPHSPTTPGCTAMAVLCLHTLDDPRTSFATRRETREGARFLERNPLKDDTQYFYYDTFFVTQAAWRAGDSTFSAISPSSFSRLLKLQQPDGGWPESKEAPSRAYTTSLALLSLSVSYHLLPIEQR